ncbi:putative Synaptogenesis protein syg-2 [Hypsibius exemplaris]|uniref:Synaptogenesis protein syg-2 n=1 Tax=Hypsibius exemplaris TaxID=2072580 RepID=A0A1W0WCL2_HYPEX|nr:putative Synaptogenesis protein syg-2 [Hypsibius exemplaris]
MRLVCLTRVLRAVLRDLSENYTGEAIWTLRICGAEDSVSKYFLQPLRNVTVHVGETVVFDCFIVDRSECVSAGWKHKGTIEFLRDLPYSPGDMRKTFVSASATGPQKITIQNVSEDDEGPIDCIANCNRALAAPFGGWVNNRAFLTVLAAPSHPVITTNPPLPVSGILETRVNDLVNLTCSAQGGRPVPKLLWFRGPVRIEGNWRYSMTEINTTTATYSSLVFQARPEDTGTGFTCQAESPALQTPSAVTVNVNVIYAPAMPVIENANGSRVITVRENAHDFSLFCSTTGGNPEPTLAWYRKTILDGKSTTVPVESQTTAGKQTLNARIAVLTFTPTRSDNGATMSCQASSSVLPNGIATSVELNVQYGPSSVELTTPASIKPNTTIPLQCKSSPSNPAAEMYWMVNNKRYEDHSKSHTTPESNGGFVTTVEFTMKIRERATDITVTCVAINPVTKEKTDSKKIILIDVPNRGRGAPTAPSEIEVRDVDNQPIEPSNITALEMDGASFVGTKPDNLTMVIAISASIGGAVFFALLGCLIYVIIRGKAKKFEEMANSDSSGSSKGHTEVCSQNGMDLGTDTTSSDVEKTPMDSYTQPKSGISPSAVRANAARTYLLDEAYHSSPYGTYKHWTAPEPVSHDLYNEVGVDYDGEGDYTEALRRTAMQSLMPHAHSPSPLRPIPNHITYEPIHKTSMLSTFHGQHIPTYRAEALVDELKGHLV